MYTLNFTRALKEMSVDKIRDFIFENYYKRIGFSKENSHNYIKCLKRKYLLLFTNQLIKKILDPRNAKKHFQSFIRKKKRKSVKKIKNNYYVDIKSVLTVHPQTSHKLSKTIRQAEKWGSSSSLYSDTQKGENFLNKKNVKITK